MNRFEIALQALDKINPDITDKYFDHELSNVYKTQPQKDLVSSSSGTAAYIRTLLPLPSYTILLGVCEDKSPLLLDLANPSCGSILISGQQSEVISPALYTILNSASIINPANIVQYAIITSNHDSFSTLIRGPHYLNSFDSNSRIADEFVMDLSVLVEQRNTGRQQGPAIILAIDDISRFTHHMDDDVYAHFKWILREGPFVKVWPIVTILDNAMSMIEIDLLQSFRTRILEFSSIPVTKSFVSQSQEYVYTRTFFEVHSGRERIPYYLPVG